MPDMPGPRLGIDAENLNDHLGPYFGAADGEGVLVRSVQPDSPAAKAGLKAGDVIVKLNDQPVHSVADLRTKLAFKDEKTAKLGKYRGPT